MPRRIVLSMIAICAIAACVVLLTHSSLDRKNTVQESSMTSSTDVAYWKDTIKRYGPQEAHDKMVEEGRKIAPLSAHMMAHAFGDALFESGGLPYLTYCGAGEFLFGCYHQFIGMATKQYGVDIIPQLKSFCDATEDNHMSCIHGIGHGLTGGYGYDLAGITKALKGCDSLFSVENEKQVCADGAFMEYNLHMSMGADAMTNHRAFDETSAYSPCTDIDPKFKDQCIFELPLWWYYSLTENATSTDAVFQNMGDLCRAAPSSISQKACFTGLGFPVAIEGLENATLYDPLCSAASKSETEKTVCLAGAYSCFYQDPIHMIWKASVY